VVATGGHHEGEVAIQLPDAWRGGSTTALASLHHTAWHRQPNVLHARESDPHKSNSRRWPPNLASAASLPNPTLGIASGSRNANAFFETSATDVGS
jgi:hypothetical protein